MPARSTAVMWTNTSGPPLVGWMKPKPLCELKNFTIPVAAMLGLLLSDAERRLPARATSREPHVRFRRCLGKRPSGRMTRQANLEPELHRPLGVLLQTAAGAFAAAAVLDRTPSGRSLCWCGTRETGWLSFAVDPC